MKTRLKMKCPYCGHWNRVPVNKIFIEQRTPEPKVKAYISCMTVRKTQVQEMWKENSRNHELIRIRGMHAYTHTNRKITYTTLIEDFSVNFKTTSK